MQKYLTVASSFVIMLCLGGVYAWSIFVPELIKEFNYSSWQTQLVFGLIIGVFPTTMLIGGKLEKKFTPRTIALLSALFFSVGYLLAGFSNGNYLLIVLGIGVLVGIGTGLGYLVALTTPVKWFPDKKGLVTGIAAAGFGLAAVNLSFISEKLLDAGKSVLIVFTLIGLVYGLIIFIFSFFLKSPQTVRSGHRVDLRYFFKSRNFIKLVVGIFLGTFAGLLVIGSLTPIGAQFNIDHHTLVIGVSVFAVANFFGRLAWGFVSDYIDATIAITMALILQGAAIFFIGYLPLNASIFLILSFLIGFGFGSNFVLFAKETSQRYGLGNLGIVYPYVFLGYALAGIAGPLTGGFLYDVYDNYSLAIYLASAMSFAGAALFVLSRKGRS